MFEYMNTAGYDLFEPFPGHWVIDLKNGNAFHGTFIQVIKYMIHKLDFYAEDIEIAVEEMTFKEHNSCHFGMNKTFIYSFIKEINVDKAS